MVSLGLVILVAMGMVVTTAGQLEGHEADARGDQNATHDRSLRALNV